MSKHNNYLAHFVLYKKLCKKKFGNALYVMVF